MGRSRRAREEARANEVVACTYGAVAHQHDESALAHVRKETHDRVIAQVGAARRSGVTWLQLSPAEGIALLNEPSAFPAGDVGEPGARDSLIAFLQDNPESMLVVATCQFDLRVLQAALS